MWKFVALFGLMGSPVLSHDLHPDQCNLDDLFLIVKQVAVGPFGLPDRAVFPEIENVKVEQAGSTCYFIFDFDFEVQNIDGETAQAGAEIAIFRFWDDVTTTLRPPSTHVFSRR
jgi:hypothetical protein